MQSNQKKTQNFNWNNFLKTMVIISIVAFAIWYFFLRGEKYELITLSKFEELYEEKDIKIDGFIFEERYRNLFVKINIGGKIRNWQITGVTLDEAKDFLEYWPIKDGLYPRLDIPKPGFLDFIVQALPTILFLAIWFYLMKRANSSMGNMFNNSKSVSKIVSNKRFTDIAGQEEAKEEVAEIVDFLKNPSRYKAAGARMPKGIILGGPPGTGKTLLAKAVSGEAGVLFFSTSGSGFVEMFAGLGAKRVRDLFSEARKFAPAILFIDEIDAIGRKRGGTYSGNDEREQTLNQILTELDGMEENNGLIVMAATNRLDVLDDALLRPGRFDRSITLRVPDIKERKAILELHAKGKRIANNVNFENIAKRTPGYSGAQLENIINEATILSVREKTNIITLTQIDEAIDRVVAGPAKKHRVITKKELEMTAYHEAGHAVLGLTKAYTFDVDKITIIPRGNTGGYNLMTPKEEKYNYSKSELEAKIMSFMGGRAAEQIMYGENEVSTGASNDIEKATEIARAMVTKYGMSNLGPITYSQETNTQYFGGQKNYSESLAEKIDDSIRSIILEAEQKAIETIKQEKELLILIAEELLENETIVREEIQYIYENRKRPIRDKKSNIEIEPSFTKKDLSNLLNKKPSKTPNTKKSNSLPNKKNEE